MLVCLWSQPPLGAQPSLYEKEVPLFDLLTEDDAGQGGLITSVPGWEKKREAIKVKWIDRLLGAFPSKVRLDIRESGFQEYPDYTQKRIEYLTARDERVKAYLLLPKPLEGKHPAVLAAHPSSDRGSGSVVGLAENANWWYALDLVKRGYVVLAPDVLTTGARIFSGRAAFDTRPFYEVHPDWSMFGKMLWDHMRAVDVLTNLKFVDPRRIGAVGWSLGAHNSAFLAAFDDRIGATVSVGGLFMIAGNPNPFAWCRDGSLPGQFEQFSYIPRLRPYLERGSVPFDFHEIQALIAPRAYLDINAAPGDHWRGSIAAAAKLRHVYRLYGAEERFGHRIFDGPHGFRPNMKAVAYTWLDRWLKERPRSNRTDRK